MKPTRILSVSIVAGSFFLLLASDASAQLDVGNYTITGQAEATGLPRYFNGHRAKFEEYRDIPESVVIPQLQLMIDGKANDFYAEFESIKPGLDDQNFRLRAGRYGLVEMEFEWDQIPHNFNLDTAQTPYFSSDGGARLRLRSKPAATVGPVGTLGNPAVPNFTATGVQGTPATQTCGTNPFCSDWLNDPAVSGLYPIDLKLFTGIARFKIRYTPNPGWTFSGSYWSNNNSGKRAFGSMFGPSPGTYNITELPEPIDYMTHNMELGGEYAGNGWTLGLRYNGSFFHNNSSTLVWDNPVNISGVGDACLDQPTYTLNNATGAVVNQGSCRGRLDLYPSNQAHTFTLSGTAALPMKTQFISSVSYGWRSQDDRFLPHTINRCYTRNPALVGTNPAGDDCNGNLLLLPSLPGGSLNGDVRPLMINATLTNNFFRDVSLKGFYRHYSLDNKSRRLTFTQGLIVNDSNAAADVGVESHWFEYSKNTTGAEVGYRVTRWMNAKLGYAFERTHREQRQLENSDEHGVGPTIDMNPWSWLNLRVSYRHLWRNASGYNDRPADEANASRMFDQAARNRDRLSLFTQLAALDTLTFYGNFEFTNDKYNKTTLGLKYDINYSPSVGFVYSPLEWVRIFGDYNWDRFDWRLRGMQRSASGQDPDDPATCDANCLLRIWNGRGREQVHTITLGTDVDLIKDLLGMRVQYAFSNGNSAVRNSGSTCLTAAGLPFPAAGACTPATDYPTISNTWHELLTRFQYSLHRNLALNLGYFYNRYNSKDPGVDIMRTWMGDQDQWGITGNANLGRSIFLGDRLKGPYTAHIALLGVRFRF
jgi:hypothetical protein